MPKLTGVFTNSLDYSYPTILIIVGIPNPLLPLPENEYQFTIPPFI